MCYLDRVSLLQRVEDVVRKTRQQVNKQPALQVVDSHRAQVQNDVTGSGDEFGHVTGSKDTGGAATRL